MYTSVDLTEHIGGHFPAAEKMLSSYDAATFELYKASLSSSLTLLQFLERLEDFIACYDHITKANGDINEIAGHLFSTTEYSTYLEGDRIVFKEEYEAPERTAEIPLDIYATLLKLLHQYIKAIRFYSNGQVIIQDNYSAGKRNGDWKAWYENGNIEFTGKYMNNLKVGEWNYYYVNSAISCQEFYDNTGKAILIHKRWYNTGQIASEQYYWLTEKPGRQKMWDEKGKLIFNGTFTLPGKPQESLQQYELHYSGLKNSWKKYIECCGKQIFNSGLTEFEAGSHKGKIRENLLYILQLNNGQKKDHEGVFAFPKTSGGNYRFRFLSAEQIPEVLDRIKNRDGVYEKFPERSIPFAISDMDTLEDILCIDDESGRIKWVWDEYEEAQEPFWFQGNVYNSREVAGNLEEFIKNQIGLNFHVEEKDTEGHHSEEKQLYEDPIIEPIVAIPLIEQTIGKTKYHISLPGDYIIKENIGPDFSTYYFIPVNKDKKHIGAGGIYIGGHPNKFYEKKGHTFIHQRYHKLLEQIPEWKMYKSDEGYFCTETVISNGPFEAIHVFASVDSMEDLAHWVKIFASLKENSTTETEKSSRGIINGRITLYDLKSDDLKINVEAYFEGENLVIDGCDLGKFVKDTFGDADYEYKMTLPEEEVSKLFKLWAIETRSKENVLLEIYERFNGQHSFSGLKDFFDKNKIRYEYFSWT